MDLYQGNLNGKVDHFMSPCISTCASSQVAIATYVFITILKIYDMQDIASYDMQDICNSYNTGKGALPDIYA